MRSFWTCCVCLLSFLPTNNSVPYPSNRCSENDCSFQLQDVMNDTCKIYNTSVCLESFEDIVGFEENSKFYVSIDPYTAELTERQEHVVYTVTRSAINITFAINDTDIHKLIVKLYKKDMSSGPLCRIFDFHIASNITKFPINLFYDCLNNLAENGMQNVRMDFIALPVEEKLSYNVFIPGTEYDDSCAWQPLIMVFRGNLHKGIVQVKFSQAPGTYNVTSYLIKLAQHPSGFEKVVEISPDRSRSMLFAHFPSNDGGIYSVSVKPVIWGVHHNCSTETDKFGVEIPKSYHMLTIYLCIFVLLIFSAFVFLKMFRRNIALLRFGSRRQILLIYSHDCDEHKNFVIAFIDYLIKHCHVDVFTLYDEPTDCDPHEKSPNIILNVNECNPLEWIKERYNNCDIIMFLISAGLFYTLDSDHSRPIQKCHEWRQQLDWVMSIITSELKNNADNFIKKKFCQVCFEYSKEENIPNILRLGFGKCYRLPQEMNSLINFMHDSGKCFQCSKLCVTNFESSFKDTNLFKKMEDVQAAVKSNSDTHTITPLKDTATQDLNSIIESENGVEISTTSDSSDDNFDSVENFLSTKSESLPKSRSKGRFERLPSFDNIYPMGKIEKFVDQATYESGGDSDSEISDCFQPKFHSETEANEVIENFFNKI